MHGRGSLATRGGDPFRDPAHRPMIRGNGGCAAPPPHPVPAPARQPSDDDALARVVVQRNPFGILVVEDGVVAAANPAAARILSVDELEGRRCCTLLGCGGPDAPVAVACLTERALEEGRPLPGVRFDVAPPHRPRGGWGTPW